MKYVVQTRLKVPVGGKSGNEMAPSDIEWVDVATVDAMPRERRATIIRRAFAERPPDGPVDVRVLDAASAEVHPVKARQQTVLEVG